VRKTRPAVTNGLRLTIPYRHQELAGQSRCTTPGRKRLNPGTTLSAITPLSLPFLGPLPDNLACPPTGKYDGRARSLSSLNILLLLTVLFSPLPGELLRSLPVDLLCPLQGDPVWPPSASKASMYPVCRIELNVLYDIFVTNYLSCYRFLPIAPTKFLSIHPFVIDLFSFSVLA
jgi:hypothetical protein